MDKVTGQCPENHNLFEEKGEPKRYRTEVLPLTGLTPYRWAKPAHFSFVLGGWCFTAEPMSRIAASTPPRYGDASLSTQLFSQLTGQTQQALVLGTTLLTQALRCLNGLAILSEPRIVVVF